MLSLVLGGGGETLGMEIYADAAWADELEQYRSTLGFRIAIGEGLVSWKSKISDAMALSTAEAEYYAGTEAVKEAEWLQGLLGELGWELGPYTVKMDAESAMAMIKTRQVNARNKHIGVKHHFIRRFYEEKRFTLEEVASADNLADCLTKALPAVKLQEQMSACLKEVPERLLQKSAPK